MKLIRFTATYTGRPIHINPDHIVCVEQNSDDVASGTNIMTDANANGLHIIVVDEDVDTVTDRLLPR